MQKNDAFPITLDASPGGAVSSYTLYEDGVKWNGNPVRVGICGVEVHTNGREDQFIYSVHVDIIALDLSEKIIKDHVKCLSMAFGIEEASYNMIDGKTISEGIEYLRGQIKEQYWKLR